MDREDAYMEVLTRAYEKMPSVATTRRRFEVPQLQSTNIGNRTFIPNFKQISEVINRENPHLLRFFSKQLATGGSLEGDQAVFQGKFSNHVMASILNDYVNEFVICGVCKGPDTKIIKEDRFRFLVCEACGARSSIRQI